MRARRFNIADLFELVAATRGEVPALCSAEDSISYEALDRLASRLAFTLEDAGVRAGEHVAIFAPSGAQWLLAMVAITKVPAVPVNVYATYDDDDLRHVLGHSDTVAVLHGRSLVDRLDAARASAPAIRTTIELDSWFEEARCEPVSHGDREHGPRSGDDRFLLYTGRTTGPPKGVLWRQEDLIFGPFRGGRSLSNPAAPAISTPEEILERLSSSAHATAIPLFFGGGYLHALSTLLRGGTLGLIDKPLSSVATLHFLDEIEARFLMLGGDAMAEELLRGLASDSYGGKLESLMVVRSAGAVLSPENKARLLEVLPWIAITDELGSSEAGHVGRASSSVEQAGDTFALLDDAAVLDSNLRPIPAGSPKLGRLARRAHTSLGYYKDPVRTVEVVVTDDEGRRWTIQTDIVRHKPDGTIEFIGRGSQVIVRDGVAIYPEAIEAVLRTHSSVRDVLVVGMPADGRELVCAIAEPENAEDPPGLEALRALCDSDKRVPVNVPDVLRVVPSVVRSPAGKPDYEWAKTLVRQLPDGAR